MDNMINVQTGTKTYFRTISLITALALVLLVPLTNAYGAPPDNRWGGKMGVNCTGESKGDRWFVTCCWREPIPGQILGQSYCQKCESTGSDNNPKWVCEPKKPQALVLTPERDESVFPKNGEAIEETEQTDSPFADKGQITGESLSGQELEQVQPSESQNSGTSQGEEGLSSDSTGLGTTFNEIPQNGNLNEEGDNDTS